MTEIKATYKKIVCTQLSTDFKNATEVREYETSDLVSSMKEHDVLIQIEYTGINASDINFTAGRYAGKWVPPFDVGFEGLGVVVKAGSESILKEGQAVMFMSYGAFSEYAVVDSRLVVPIPESNPKYLAALVGGLTGVLPFKHMSHLSKGNVVLITAAAGGVGHIAVQYAASKGCKVVGTCSSEKKAEFLKTIGCENVINYKKEDLDKSLSRLYPSGLNVVLESVGGETYKCCLKHLAPRGQLIVIGSISHYRDGGDSDKFQWADTVSTSELLSKSLTVSSFFLFHFKKETAEALPELIRDIATSRSDSYANSLLDKIRAQVDVASSGIENIDKAVEYLHTGASMGKVVASINATTSRV